MQIRQNTWILLSTALLVTLTSKSSFAFTLNQSPGFFDYGAYSIFLGKGQGYTTLNAADPEDPFSLIKSRLFVSAIELGGTSGLLSDLQIYRNDGWTFNRGSNLKGSFDVKRQYACGNLTLCGSGTKLSIGLGGIGSVLELNYRPSKSERNPDPNPTKDSLFWIQRVITNYSPGQPGVRKSYIDNVNSLTGLNATYPYYGRGNPINASGYFGDRPYRISNLDRDYYWIAELYLAKSDKFNPQEITIYNGVRWGWLYKYFSFTPPPPSPPPPAPTCIGGSGGSGCYRSNATDYVDYTDYQESSALDSNDVNEFQYRDLSFFNLDEFDWTEGEEVSSFDEYNNSESPTSVPESTSTLGLLALGAWGIIKAMKICFEQ